MLLVRSLWIFVVLSLIMISCGKESIVHVREFNIYAETNDPEVKETLSQLIDQYNSDVNGQVLNLVDTEEQANSSIRFQRNMLATEHRLGHARWSTLKKTNGDAFEAAMSERKTVIQYSMHMIFDLENFKRKTRGRFDKGSVEWRHLYHLFCHEVGHGLQMDHDGNPRSVMYSKISQQSRDDLDYEDYFTKAREFFTQP